MMLLLVAFLIHFQRDVSEAAARCNESNEHVHFGYKNYTEYIPGHKCSPIIIIASHGGNLTPTSIADRNMGCFINNKCVWSHTCGKTSPHCKASTCKDSYTQEMAKLLKDEIKKITGVSPYLILSHLNRSKVDMNSRKDEATFGVEGGVRAYDDFHYFIKMARKQVKRPAILFDIHGHGHEDELIELGYLIKGDTLDNETNPNHTSLRALSNRHHLILFERILLHINDSLGGILQQLGYKTVPSPDNPGPIGEDFLVKNRQYFSGGFITQHYGSRDQGDIDAIQISSPKSLRLSTTYAKYCKDLAKGLVKFVRKYYYVKVLDSQYGYKNYTQYIPGSRCSPIIISVPHGGYLKPKSIPDRIAGCFQNNKCIYNHTCGNTDTKCEVRNTRDQFTLEIGFILKDNIQLLSEEAPHIIISHLARIKLDPNRDKDTATFGVEEAIKAYDDFHNFVKIAMKAVNGPGMLFLLHGHIHKADDWIELGYLLPNNDLDNGPINPNISSIRALANRHCSISFDQILRGSKTSLGGLLQNLGYKTVPSHIHPGPGGGVYLPGVYMVTIYGSRDNGVIDSVQVESPLSLRQPDTYAKYANDLAKVIVNFVRLYY